jgi:hypothetical protein
MLLTQGLGELTYCQETVVAGNHGGRGDGYDRGDPPVAFAAEASRIAKLLESL